MKSEELAYEVDKFIMACQERVLGTGHEQYSDGERQKFELMEIDDLFIYLEEELRDVAAYSTMLHIRLDRLREALRLLPGSIDE